MAFGINWLLRWGALPIRRDARMIVLDSERSILLVRYEDTRPGRPASYWATPGGDVEMGETHEQAAQRELREETGLVADIGRELWRGSFTADYGLGMLHQVERFFEVRLPSTRPLASNRSKEAVKEGIKELKWWTLQELSETKEVIFPDGFAQLLRTHLR